MDVLVQEGSNIRNGRGAPLVDQTVNGEEVRDSPVGHGQELMYQHTGGEVSVM